MSTQPRRRQRRRRSPATSTAVLPDSIPQVRIQLPDTTSIDQIESQLEVGLMIHPLVEKIEKVEAHHSNLIAGPSVSTSFEIAAPNQSSAAEQQTRGEKTYCQVCRLRCSSEIDLEKHVQGRKHQARSRQLSISPPARISPGAVLPSSSAMPEEFDLNQITLVTEELLPVIQAFLSKETDVAFDCEGVNLGRFGQLTLATIATRTHAFVFDMIDLPKTLLHFLKSILENSQIIKIVHDCRQDSDALHKHVGIRLAGIFDTSAIDAFANHSVIRRSLNELLTFHHCPINEDRKNIDYDKTPAFWADRPLTEEMLQCAAKDCLVLLDLMDRMCESVFLQRTALSSPAGFQKALDLSYRNGCKLRDCKLVERVESDVFPSKRTRNIRFKLGYISRSTNVDIWTLREVGFVLYGNDPKQMRQAHSKIIDLGFAQPKSFPGESNASPSFVER